MKNQPDKMSWKFMIFLILAILAFSYLTSYFISFSLDMGEIGGNAALIKIKGTIATEESGGVLGGEGVTSSEIVEQIKKAKEDDSIKAIVFEINSPGGSPVGSKEIVTAIKNVNKTTVSYIREVGASGAYWVASATDIIIADELSITGSIGVIGSYIEFAGLLQKYNMTYRRFVGGEYKDLGDPFKKLEFDEQQIMQSKIDKIHEYFIQDVADNRNISLDRMKELATGEFYLGMEAKELGLIDMFGNQETAKEAVKERLNLTKVEFVTYEKPPGFLDLLAKIINERSFYVGRGIGNELMNVKNTNRINIAT